MVGIMRPAVHIEEISSESEIEKVVRRIITELNYVPGEKVYIKPNICCYKPSYTGATTDINFIKALLNIFPNVDFTIVESDSMGTNATKAFKKLGYADLGIESLNLSNEKHVQIDGLPIPRILLNSEIIALPKIKTHIEDGLSCALKNQFGFIPIKNKDIYHNSLASTVLKINTIIKPKLFIVDGLFGMEGEGPVKGKPRKMNIIMGGLDPVAIDSFCADLIGINKSLISHLRKCDGIIGSKQYKLQGSAPKIKNFEFPWKEYIFFKTLNILHLNNPGFLGALRKVFKKRSRTKLKQKGL